MKEQSRLKGVIVEVPPVSIKNYINKSSASIQSIQTTEYGLTSDEKLMAAYFAEGERCFRVMLKSFSRQDEHFFFNLC